MGRLALPPGFRFHPTDEELVTYYLKRKVAGRKIVFEAIGDLDLYKFEPWDLPELSRLQTKDLEWYFFCPRDKKYPNGSRTNRATENGYWKATGKDREVASRSVSVGMKKTLVYYKGRAPKGERTNWVMHEYRLEDTDGDRTTVLQNGFVLCRIYQKSGAGPKNGEQYGAPVEEEDWEAAAAGEIDSLGATLSSALYSAGASGGIFDTKPSTPKDMAAEQLAGLRTEPADVVQKVEEDIKFTNLPVEMIAELGERAIMNHQPIAIDKACFSSESDYVSSADLISSFISPPEGEEEILEEIQGLVSTSDDGNGQAELLEEAEAVGCFPRDGGFFELDDLSPVLNLDDSLERDGNGKDIWGLNSGRISWLSRMGLQDNNLDGHFKKELCLASGRDCCYVGAGAGEPADSSTQTREIPEMEPSCTTCIASSSCQAGDESDIEKLLPYAGVYGAQCESCGMGGNEPEYGDVLQFFEQFSTTYADQRESFNAEILGETLLPTNPVQAESSKVAVGGTDQDEQFLDAFMSFSDLADENVQSLGLSSPGQTADDQANYSKRSSPSKELLSESTFAAKPVVNKVTTTSTAGPQPSVSEVKILRAEAQKKSSMKFFDSRGASKALGALINCLDSIPSLPANASAMSPKVGTQVGSISVLASSVDIRAVAIKCSCTKEEDASSPCVTCSFAKRGTFVRSLSYTGGRTVVEGPSLSFSALAILGVLWALFWLLMVGGAWKLLGGVYRMVFY